MPTFAFWNISNNVSIEHISAFALEHDVDVLALAESKIPTHDLTDSINQNTDRIYFNDIGISDRLTILTRFNIEKTMLIMDKPHFSIRHYNMPLGESILFVGVHLSSLLWKDTRDQTHICTRIARYVREAEAIVGHTRTIIMGDFNMNPFASGIVGAEGLHAVMDRRIAATSSRNISGETYTFMYNPMWFAYSSSDDNSPQGTYFYNSGNELNYYWNVFDQVIIRPSLLNFLRNDSVQIITNIQGNTLLAQSGRPNKKDLSDHLPIICNLDVLLENTNDD